MQETVMQKQQAIGSHEKKQRDSNIELFRIVSMLLIIAHHYVVNSGLTGLYDFSNVTGNMVFLQIFSAFGKMGINCFTLITGYFMIHSSAASHPRRVLKLFLEVLLYRFVIHIILFFGGYADWFSAKYIVTEVLFSDIFYANRDYVASLLCFYLLIPFLNRFIKALTQRQLLRFLGIVLVIYSVIATFSVNNDTWNYIPWLGVMYCIGAYIRLYPCPVFDRKSVTGTLAAGAIILMIASILAIDLVGVRFGFTQYHYMCSNANKLLPLVASVALFLLFRSLPMGYSRIINTLAASAFGVLMIHGNSALMHQWLWKDTLQNTAVYESPYLVLHAVLSVLGIYLICAGIDMLRIRWIESPFFAWYAKKEDKLRETFGRAERKMASVLTDCKE